MSPTLTLNSLHPWDPCERGLTCFMAVHPGLAPDAPFSIGDVALANGAADAIWCLQAIPDRRLIVRAIMPAVRRASAKTTDARVHQCIEVVQRWLDGDEAADLKAAADAAWAAAWASSAAADAAWAAAWASSAAADAAWAAAAAERAAADAADAADSSEEERKRQVADLIDLFPPLLTAPSSRKGSNNG